MNKDIKEYSSIGGKTRSSKLSPERRKEIAVLAAKARWSNKQASISDISKQEKQASIGNPLTSRKCALCGLRFSSHETDEWGWANRGIIKHEFVESV